MGTTEQLGLKLTADSSEWTAAFTQAQAGAKKLGDEVAKTAEKHRTLGDKLKEVTEATKEQFEELGKFSLFFNEITAAAQKFGDAFKKVFELSEFSAELDNMRQRIPTVQLQAMQKATEGTVDKLTLMKFAMKATSGELALTERGLNTVLGAAQHLSDEGLGPTTAIAEKLNHALRTGSADELREFGIVLKQTSDKTKVMNEAMEKYRDLAATHVNVNPQLQALRELKAGYEDLTTSIKEATGHALMFLGASAAKAVGTVGKDFSRKATQALMEDRDQARARQLYEQATGVHLGAGNVPLDIGVATGMGPNADFDTYLLRARSERGLEWQRRLTAEEATKLAILKAQNAGAYFKGKPPPGQPQGGGNYNVFGAAFGNISQGDAIQAWVDKQTPVEESPWDQLKSGWESLKGTGRDVGQMAWGATIGRGREIGAEQQQRMDEFEAGLKDKTTAIGAGYDALTSGLNAAVEAAITGSESISKAFAKASAAALKSIAIESTGRAVYEGAMALGSLAVGDAAGAGVHAAAAAKFAIAAAVTGAGAAALGSASGGFGGGGASTPAGGGAVSGPSQSQNQQPTVYNLYVGDGYVGRPDELAAALVDRINHAQGTGRARLTTSQPGAVTFRS